MKNLYSITNKNGVHLCYQVAASEEDAVYAAKNYYGAKGAKNAEFVRENS